VDDLPKVVALLQACDALVPTFDAINESVFQRVFGMQQTTFAELRAGDDLFRELAPSRDVGHKGGIAIVDERL
jgi:hypothetical protein